MFKKFFTEQKEILAKLISEIINIKIKQEDINFINIEHMGNNKDNKKSLLDLEVKLPTGEYIIIEMQNGFGNDFSKRVQYYTSKVITNQLYVSQNYFTLKKVYCISFLSGKDRTDNLYPKLFTSEILCDKITKEERPSLFEFCYINLEQLENNEHKFTSFVISFLELMNIKREDVLNNMETQDEYIKKSIEYIKKINSDPVITAALDREQRERLAYNTDIETAKRSGIEQGLEQGIEQNKISMVKSMLEKNMDIKLISEISGLTNEEIEKISQN
ncbi:MAG: Rpn family recombination-promoting nuclease/putative transposase [Mycoplasmatota bacterium]